MVQDQATLLELKTMFAELKELLNQQVTHFLHTQNQVVVGIN